MSETTAERTIRAYYLVEEAGQMRIADHVPDGAKLLAGPKHAASWADAKRELQREVELHRKRAESLTPVAPVDPVFHSAHEAMVFAFRYCGQQSPKTPMSVILQQAGGPLGSGRGLTGLDGAAQAGMVLAALKHMNAEQRHVIVARYGDVRRACPCCGQPAPDASWLEAVEALSQCDALRDLPKQVRHAAIEKVVGRRKLRFQDYATEYGLSPRTLRHKLKDVKDRYATVENQAMAFLGDYFDARGLLIKG